MAWSYYGAAHRCALDDDADDARACAETMRNLYVAGDTEELRSREADGDRCAFVTLMEVLVDHDRIDDLRALAVAGDDRALATLMELYIVQEREAELRADVVRFGRVDWLLGYLVDHGRSPEALAELDHWIGVRPGTAVALHGTRVDLLSAAGQEYEVRRLAAAGDRTAVRRLRALADGVEEDGSPTMDR